MTKAKPTPPTCTTTLAKADLAEAIGRCSAAVAKKSTLPVLNNLLLQADGHHLHVTGTDLELAITAHATATHSGDWALTIPAKLFSDVVALLPDETVTLEYRPTTAQLIVSGGESANVILGIDAGEYPAVPALGEGFTLNAESLREAINQVIACAATDEARPLLTGLLWKSDGQTLTLTAADGFRLGTRAIPSTAPIPAFTAIVPARACKELSSMLAGRDTVQVVVTEKQMGFKVGGLEMVANTLEGNYPDVTNLIPKSSGITVTLDTKAMRWAAKSASVYAKVSAKTLRVTLDPEQPTIELFATGSEIGEHKSHLPALVIGTPLIFGMNAGYFTDALTAIATERVTLELNTATTPIVIRPVGRADYLYIIMPMHVGK